MAMNRIQFQAGLSLPAFLAQFGTDEQCADALEASRWPQGFSCPGCGNANYYLLKVGKHKNFQCKCCRLQTSLIAGTLFQSTHLALSIWFLAIYLISQAKTGLSALDLKRQLGVSYPTAWLIQQKLMQAMVERDGKYTLCGNVQADDAYLGGELAGGKAGRGSENKVPFVAAISLSAEGRPLYIKMAPVPGFTRKAVSDWANANLAPDCIVTSDGLGCFAGVTDAGSASTGQSSRTVASLRICQNSTGSIRFWATSKPAWVALTMHSISPNTEPVTSVRLFTVSTGASILKRSLYVCSSPQPLSGLARHVGFGKLKNLSNQVL